MKRQGRRQKVDNIGKTKSPTMVGDRNVTSEGNWKMVPNTCLGITFAQGG